MNGKKIAILIPVFNEGARLENVLTRLLQASISWCANRVDVVMVDDGSAEPMVLPRLPVLPSLCLHLLRHETNLGQGAALQTALVYSRDYLDADLFVTLDADGQHDPGDLVGLWDRMRETGADIIFGNRWTKDGAGRIPRSRRLILRWAARFERWVTGLNVEDAHNGYRLWNRTCARALLIRQNRMAHATEIKRIVARAGLRYAEAPVKVLYSEESLRKGQKNVGSLLILRDLLRGYLFDA